MRRIAIIPARSGSKGLRDKNIKLLNGKPLIAYSIEAAKASGLFDIVMVSTDSKEYADIARIWGADVPFLRSERLSTDGANSWDVVAEVLNRYEEEGQTFEAFALLQPTSPLRTAQDIKQSIEQMEKSGANAIVGVTTSDHSPLWSNSLPPDLSMSDFLRKEVLMTPRQQLPDFYRINGAMYLVKTSYFNEGHDIYRDKCYAYIMDKKHSVDIDDEVDFFLAQVILQSENKP